jgi:hypothetical protein
MKRGRDGGNVTAARIFEVKKKALRNTGGPSQSRKEQFHLMLGRRVGSRFCSEKPGEACSASWVSSFHKVDRITIKSNRPFVNMLRGSRPNRSCGSPPNRGPPPLRATGARAALVRSSLTQKVPDRLNKMKWGREARRGWFENRSSARAGTAPRRNGEESEGRRRANSLAGGIRVFSNRPSETASPGKIGVLSEPPTREPLTI